MVREVRSRVGDLGADGATAPGRTGSRGARRRTRAGAPDERSSSEGRGRSIREGAPRVPSIDGTLSRGHPSAWSSAPGIIGVAGIGLTWMPVDPGQRRPAHLRWSAGTVHRRPAPRRGPRVGGFKMGGAPTSWRPSSSVRPNRRSCAPIPPSSPRPTSLGASSPAWPRTCRPWQLPSSARKSAATWSAPPALTHRGSARRRSRL